MTSSKNPKVRNKIIDDHLNIQGIKISIKFYVNNWGEAFDKELFKKKVEQAIQESDLEAHNIKNIEVKTLLQKYLGPDKKSVLSVYTMEDNALMVHLNNGKRIQLNIEESIAIP